MKTPSVNQPDGMGLLALEGALSLALVVAILWALRRLIRIHGHLPLARLGWRRERAPKEYVAALFDGYAERYDRHLLVELGYQGANLVSAALSRYLEDGHDPPADVLDLGCGTGLLGLLLEPRVGRITGVDLSSEMLRRASARKGYGELVQMEMLEFLRRGSGGFGLITAADVLVYVGDLDAFMRLAHRHLVPGGALICTTEDLTGPRADEGGDRGFALQPTGRFAHRPEYLAAMARGAGLRVYSQEEAVLRTQRDEPVRGHVHLTIRDRSAGG